MNLYNSFKVIFVPIERVVYNNTGNGTDLCYGQQPHNTKADADAISFKTYV